VASARRVIAQALGIKRQLLKVWFFGTRLASFEVANTNVANHLVFHGFFLAGASEVAVVHSFRQATAMAMQVRASFSEVEDESTSFQIPEPLGVDQAMTVDRHKISLEGTVGSQERPGSHKGFGSFSQNYHFGPGKFIPSEASPFIGARPRVIDGDDGVGRGREDGSCMAAACMAALALPEAPTVISRNPNSNSGRATSSNPPIDNPGRCYEIPQLPAEHVESVNFEPEKGSGFPVEGSPVGEICPLPFTLMDFPPLADSGGIIGDERAFASSCSGFQIFGARSYAEVLALQPSYTPPARRLSPSPPRRHISSLGRC
jgi:hypothetical protein